MLHLHHEKYQYGSQLANLFFEKRSIDLLRNSLCLKKLAFLVQIFGKILRAYEYIWSKNFAEKMPKRAILANKWNFERGLMIQSLN